MFCQYGVKTVYVYLAPSSVTSVEQILECPALSLWEENNIQRKRLGAQLRICNAGSKHRRGKEKRATEREERRVRMLRLLPLPLLHEVVGSFGRKGLFVNKDVTGMYVVL